MTASAESIDEAMALLKADCENAVSWFTSNGMKANPGKFQFMIVSQHDVRDKKPELLVNDVVLKPEFSVKVLGRSWTLFWNSVHYDCRNKHGLQYVRI